MGFNVLCICAFYTTSIIRLQARAAKNFRLSGMLNQTDLNNACAVTKQYKIGGFYEFLTVRQIIWKIQIFVCTIAAMIGFPTTLMITLRHKYLKNNDITEDSQVIKNIDKVCFYFFTAGIFKDHSTDSTDKYPRQDTFYITFVCVFLALWLEKQSINWLTNRFGCNFNKFQKFCELEIRKQCIDEGWPVRPWYDINLYRMFYFYHDIDTIIPRFMESDDEIYKKKKEALGHD